MEVNNATLKIYESSPLQPVLTFGEVFSAKIKRNVKTFTQQ